MQWDFKAINEPDKGFVAALTEAVRGGSLLVLLQKMLSLIQQELGSMMGTLPGVDMHAAVVSARKEGAKIALVDRDIRITLNHLLAAPFREKLRLLGWGKFDVGIVGEIAGGGIESIVLEENVGPLMEEFKRVIPSIYNALVDERDRYMAYLLHKLQRDFPDSDIVCVVGAGHKKGVEKYLKQLSDGKKIAIRPLVEEKRVSKLSLVFFIFLFFVMFLLMKLFFFKRIGGNTKNKKERKPKRKPKRLKSEEERGGEND
jgi:pheromone shutdown protein TraB